MRHALASAARLLSRIERLLAGAAAVAAIAISPARKWNGLPETIRAAFRQALAQ